MASHRPMLAGWIVDALNDLGSARPAAICEHIWKRHEADLKAHGDLFYIWQYEMRWAGDALVRDKRLTKKAGGKSGTWALTKGHA